MGTISSQFAHRILGEIADSCFLALHFDSPIYAGAYASEVSGAGYVRVKVDFNEPSTRTITNTSDVRFSGLPQTRVTWVAGWTARERGDLLWHVELDSPSIISQGGGYGIGAGEIIIGL